jgi:hypothetical protein
MKDHDTLGQGLRSHSYLPIQKGGDPLLGGEWNRREGHHEEEEKVPDRGGKLANHDGIRA